MGKRYLIDSNVLLEYIGDILPLNIQQIIEELSFDEFNISIINRIEVLGHFSATDELSEFLTLANQFELTTEIAERAILLKKHQKIKLPDAIIAATALVHELILLTRNTKDFINIPGLKILEPYKL